MKYENLEDIKYLKNRPAVQQNPDIPTHRFIASCLPQHFTNQFQGKRMRLTGPQALLEQMKNIITSVIRDMENGDEEATLERHLVLENLIWQELQPNEENLGRTEVACNAKWIRGTTTDDIRLQSRQYMERTLKRAHEISSPKAVNIVGTGITTFTVANKKLHDFIIYRTFLTVNYQYLSFKFKLQAREKGFFIEEPKPIKGYPWHAHMLSDDINGTLNRAFNHENN
jgi:hypothetical protein